MSEKPNPGQFVSRKDVRRVGRKPTGRPKGSKDKSTASAKEAIARFVDGNSGRFEKWLDEIYEKEGPRAAFECVRSLLEYHVPKLSRKEVTGADEGPVELVISWAEEPEKGSEGAAG